MKIGILKVDSVLPEFRNRHGDYPQMLAHILQLNSLHYEEKPQFKTFDVEEGDYPNHIDDFDGYIIPGSRKRYMTETTGLSLKRICNCT